MKINKSLFFITIFSILVVGCSGFSSFEQSEPSQKPFEHSFNDTSNYPSYDLPSFNNETSDPVVKENQALLNRMMVDYYEQRIANSKTMSSNMYWSSVNDEQETRIAKDLTISYCFKPNSFGAYMVGIDKKSIITYDGESSFYSFNGVNIGYFYEMPDVWYKGNILYLTDAYYYGIIDDNDLSICLQTMNHMLPNAQAECLLFNANSQARYVDSITPLSINKESISSNNVGSQIKEDLYNQIIKNNDNYKNYSIELNDIHIYQSFAKVNDAICVNFSIDGITPPKHLITAINKPWDNDLSFGETIIEKFQDNLPVVYQNRSFYPIDEAFQEGIINKNTALDLIKQYKNSIEKDIGETIPLF